MRAAAVAVAALSWCVPAYAQRPSNLALLVPQKAPLLDVVPVPNPVTLPAGGERSRRALLSVTDKTGLLEFARALRDQEVEIISTGGTAKLLREGGVELIEVRFSERIKTRPMDLRWQGGICHNPAARRRQRAASDSNRHRQAANVAHKTDDVSLPQTRFDDAGERVAVHASAL